MISYCLIETSITWVALVADADKVIHIRLLSGPRAAAERCIKRDFPAAAYSAKLMPQLQREIRAYLAGKPVEFSASPHADGLTSFQREVLDACSRIPHGKTLSYAELAAWIGRPRAARAVGTALARNPLPLLIPCHRVVASNHKLGGFSAEGGVGLKRKLLALEGAPEFMDKVPPR
jgi:methylated-DNA-[protein]-cysteine S-methyltransferase